MTEVLKLVERVDAAGELHRRGLAVRRDNVGFQNLARLEVVAETADGYLLAAGEAERLPGRALGEDSGRTPMPTRLER